MTLRSTSLWMGAAAAALVWAACSASNSDDDESSESGSGAGSGQGGLDFTGSGGGDTGSSSGGACAGEDYTAEEQPLDMYIMLDQSGSMDGTTASGTRWSEVTGALSAFMAQPATAGIGVGIQYFPIETGLMCPLTCFSDIDCGSMCGPCFGALPQFNFPGFCMNAGSSSCDVMDYATPEVPIQVLPGVATAINTSMAAHGPSGNTPTSAALDGAISYARSWASATPGHVVIAVLATDGDPTDCDTDLNNIQAIAANGVAGTPSILTFVIGVGSSLQNLNAIAQAGGSGQAFIVDTNQNVEQQFLDALNQIKGSVLGCTYAIPLPTSGQPDYNQVNVEYTPSGGSPQTIPFVGSAAACPGDGNGWYYDDPQNPTQIILCDGICQTVSADDMGSIKIRLGCATLVN